MSVSSYLLSKSPAMRVVWAASVLIWMVFMGTSTLLEGCTWGADDEPRWHEPEGSWRRLLGPAAASCWAARVWSFSSAETPTLQSS
jgi:hypothetical protein